jgi:membrane protease YdiL (CAAX protease family)
MWRDRILWAFAGAGVAFWFLLYGLTAPKWAPGWPLDTPERFVRLALVYPVLEEIIFRGALQPYFARRLPPLPGPVSAANLVVSLLFTLAHFYSHPPLWAALVFIPSLAFGYLRDRHNSLQTPVALHVFYNAGYYWLFGGL